MPIGNNCFPAGAFVTIAELEAQILNFTESASCFLPFVVPPDTLDINGQPVEITTGLINTVDNVSLLYDNNNVYTIDNGVYTKIGPCPSSLIITDPHPTHRFKTTFTNIGDADITYTGTSAILADNNDVEVAYISGANIPAGIYTLYGLGITKVNFNKDVFTDIHIERNEDQTDADNMFFGLIKLVNFTAEPETFGSMPTLAETWRNCSSLTSFPIIDTSSVTDMASTWESCTSLTSFPLIDTSSVTNMESTWHICTSLISFPAIDTSSVEYMDATWEECTSLTSFPLIAIDLISEMSGPFFLCTSLICMGGFTNNGIAPTSIWGVFNNTPALLAPNATEQASILNGNTWINPNSC